MKKTTSTIAPATVVAPVTDSAALRAAFGPCDSGHAVLQSLLVRAAPAELIRLEPPAAPHGSAVVRNGVVAILVEDLFAEATTIH